MGKKVVYNGETTSHMESSDPSVLVKGRIYEVKAELNKGFQTNYILTGVEGEFCSKWFSKPEYFAVSKEFPTPCQPMILTLVGDTRTIKTTPVKCITIVGKTVYKVETKNSTYFVMVSDV